MGSHLQSYSQKAMAINRAIIYVSAPNIRIIFKQELKRMGITEIVVPLMLDDALEALVKSPDALLIVDQLLPIQELNQVLKVSNGVDHVSLRPIFFLADSISAEVLGICSEYNISRIHPGQLSRDLLQTHLSAILDQESEANELRAILSKVKTYYDMRQFYEAEELLLPLHEKAPNNVRVICEIAECLILSDRWKEAENFVTKFANQFDSNIRLQHQFARCHMKARRFEQAELVLKNCELINPFNIERLLDLGNALLQSDKVKEAQLKFESALELEPDNIFAQRGSGQCSLMLGEVNEGLMLLRQVTSDRELASIFNNSAIISVNHRKFESGISLYRTAISTLGEDGPIGARLVFNLGLAYHKKGEEIQARKCFAMACDLDSSFAKSKVNLTVLGNRSKAYQAPIEPTITIINEEEDDGSEESIMAESA